jgi:hypothetical protein
MMFWKFSGLKNTGLIKLATSVRRKNIATKLIIGLEENQRVALRTVIAKVPRVTGNPISRLTGAPGGTPVSLVLLSYGE